MPPDSPAHSTPGSSAPLLRIPPPPPPDSSPPALRITPAASSPATLPSSRSIPPTSAAALPPTTDRSSPQPLPHLLPPPPAPARSAAPSAPSASYRTGRGYTASKILSVGPAPTRVLLDQTAHAVRPLRWVELLALSSPLQIPVHSVMQTSPGISESCSNCVPATTPPPVVRTVCPGIDMLLMLSVSHPQAVPGKLIPCLISDSHHQRVYKKSNHLLQLRFLPVRYRQSHHDVFLPAVPRQQHRDSRQHRHI